MNLSEYIKSAGGHTDEGFLRTIQQNPLDAINYGIYADWLEENGRDHDAAVFRDVYERLNEVIPLALDAAKRNWDNYMYDYGDPTDRISESMWAAYDEFKHQFPQLYDLIVYLMRDALSHMMRWL